MVVNPALIPDEFLISGVPYTSQDLANNIDRSGWCFVTSLAEVLSYFGIRNPDGGDMKRWGVAGIGGFDPFSGIPTEELKYVALGNRVDRGAMYVMNSLGVSSTFTGGLWSGALFDLLHPLSKDRLIKNYVRSVVSQGNPLLLYSVALGHAITIVGYDSRYVYVYDTAGAITDVSAGGNPKFVVS